jgi:hypothetical protein
VNTDPVEGRLPLLTTLARAAAAVRADPGVGGVAFGLTTVEAPRAVWVGVVEWLWQWRYGC